MPDAACKFSRPVRMPPFVAARGQIFICVREERRLSAVQTTAPLVIGWLAVVLLRLGDCAVDLWLWIDGKIAECRVRAKVQDMAKRERLARADVVCCNLQWSDALCASCVHALGRGTEGQRDRGGAGQRKHFST